MKKKLQLTFNSIEKITAFTSEFYSLLKAGDNFFINKPKRI